MTDLARTRALVNALRDPVQQHKDEAWFLMNKAADEVEAQATEIERQQQVIANMMIDAHVSADEIERLRTERNNETLELGRALAEIERLRSALVESVLANERAFHDLAMYAAVDTVNPPAWFRSKFDGLSEAIRAARAALGEPKP